MATTPIKVLLVEDDPDDALLIRELLAEASTDRFELEHRDRLELAIDSVATAPFDVAVLDLSLPDSDRAETLSRLRSRADRLPIVVLTGLDDSEAAAESLHQGAQDYLVKAGLDSDLLTRTLRYAIERKKVEEELRRRVRQQAAVAELGLKAAAGVRLRALLWEAVRVVSEVLQSELCGVFENLPGSGLRLVSGVGWQEGRIDDAVEAAGTGSLAGYTVATGTPVIVDDLSIEARFDPGPLLGEHDVVSALSVVIHGEGPHPFGALAAMSRDQREYSPDDVYFLQSVANVVVSAFQRAHAETERLEQEARFRGVSENLAEGVMIVDLAGKVVYANPQALEMTAARGASLDGTMVSDLISGIEVDWEGAADAVATRLEGDLARRGGAPLPVEVHRSPFRDGSGAVVGTLLAITDLTERRKLEEQFRQAQKMEAVGRLAGGVAHDFNNLLTAINGYSEMILSQVDADSSIHGELVEINKAGKRAAALTRQLLAFSRQQVLQPEIVDLNAVVADLGKLLVRLIGENIESRIELDPELAAVRADPGQLQQVILNLAVNARDAMPKGGILTLSTSNVSAPGGREGPQGGTDGYVLLTVHDTGEGMDQETCSHIFEPFFTTKERGKGTGLGLSTVYGIIRQSGGTIDVDTAPGAGTTFRIYMPAIHRDAVTETRPERPATTTDGDETVLLVEDEDSVRKLSRRILERHGYAVLEASNPEEALQLVATYDRDIELMVSDLILPGMNGPELAKRIRSSRTSIKILFMSGYSSASDVATSLIGPGEELLEKPFAPEALLEAVREALDSTGD